MDLESKMAESAISDNLFLGLVFTFLNSVH